jgi:DNA-binding response OmpR family regulator
MTPAKILIADDSLVVRSVIRKQLAPEGFAIAEVADGESVLKACRTEPPDVVLLDVEMPGMTGYEVLREMQADPSLAHIPVVFLSGRVSAEDVAKGLELGAHDYLRKPTEPGELLARVTVAVRAKARYDDLRRDNAALRMAASTTRPPGTAGGTPPPPRPAPSPDQPAPAQDLRPGWDPLSSPPPRRF